MKFKLSPTSRRLLSDRVSDAWLSKLADALRPACNLLHESLDVQERNGLSVFGMLGELVFGTDEEQAIGKILQSICETARPIESQAHLVSTSQVASRRRWTSSPWLLASLCLALAMLLVVQGPVSWSGTNVAPAGAVVAA